jgi:murein DD-endopeptidase MepM/ murein hydrolase activator NlpD
MLVYAHERKNHEMKPMILVTLGLLLLVAPSRAQDAFPTIAVQTPAGPRPLIGGGRTHLAYELYLTNLSARDATVESIEVRDARQADGPVLLRLEGAALAGSSRRLGPSDEGATALPGGRTEIVFVWVTLPSTAVPTSLTHRIAIRTGSLAPAGTTATGEASSLTVRGYDVAVSPLAPPVIDAPLEGDDWLAANGPDNDTGHRRAVFALNGAPRIAQRFAIDWVRLFPEGRTWRGDARRNDSFRAYGTKALAVADGVVTDTVDGITENAPDPVARAVAITPRTIGGNSVILDLGHGIYAFYGHLQPGHLLVKKGDRVRRGQAIGLVGNSGNSSEPHLHFHLASGAGFDAEGLPYKLRTFDLEAPGSEVASVMRAADSSLAIDADALMKWRARSAERRLGEIPMGNALIRFPGR